MFIIDTRDHLDCTGNGDLILKRKSQRQIYSFISKQSTTTTIINLQQEEKNYRDTSSRR